MAKKEEADQHIECELPREAPTGDGPEANMEENKVQAHRVIGHILYLIEEDVPPAKVGGTHFVVCQPPAGLHPPAR